MSSGNRRVYFNFQEKAISDDHNVVQDFVAQERNDILRALMQRPYSEFLEPGVSIPTTSVADGLVLDGLDLNVDSPGNVLVNPGVLACWIGPASANDSGLAIVVDAGVQTLGQLTIVTNGGVSPRCDVIECRVKLAGADTVVQANRDIYDESTEEFVPTLVNKFFKAVLQYRVRQGTAGTPPGIAAGWLPLGFAVVQPGATVAQVDFYDCRPLWRDVQQADEFVDSAAAGPIARSTKTQVDAPNALVAGDQLVQGYAEARYAGVRVGGPLYKSSPIDATQLGAAGWASTAAGGGDRQVFALKDDNFVRGASKSIASGDLIIISAWFPDLGGVVPLRRCVRYSEGVPGTPVLPSRRRPTGPNGILLATTQSQDPLTANMYTATLLAATGLGGCLGLGVGIPLAMAPIEYDGTSVGRMLQQGTNPARWRKAQKTGVASWSGCGPKPSHALDSNVMTVDLRSYAGFARILLHCLAVLDFSSSENKYVAGTLTAWISEGAAASDYNFGSTDVCVDVQSFAGYAGTGPTDGHTQVEFALDVPLYAFKDAANSTRGEAYLHIKFEQPILPDTITVETGVTTFATGVFSIGAAFS